MQQKYTKNPCEGQSAKWDEGPGGSETLAQARGFFLEAPEVVGGRDDSSAVSSQPQGI